MSQNIDLVGVAGLWTKYFGSEPDDLMKKAFDNILKNAERWPSVTTINDAINELKKTSYTSSAFRQIEHVNKGMSPSAKKAFDAVKNGEYKSYFGGTDINEIKGYVKERFPDISEALIRQNYNELAYAAEFNEKCKFCQWCGKKLGCETNGYYPIPKLEKKGYIMIEYAPCVKKRGVSL